MDQITQNNAKLQERIRSLRQANQEFEVKCQIINNEEQKQFEEIKHELMESQEKLRESRFEIEKLKKENSATQRKLENLELSQSRKQEKAEKKLEEYQERIEDLEADLTRQKEAVNGIRIQMNLKEEELENARMSLKRCQNELKGISQINKGNQITIRSLENERTQVQKQLTKAERRSKQLKQEILDLTKKIKKSSYSNEKIELLINEFFEGNSEYSSFENLSVDSYIEQKLDLNKSLKLIDEEFRNKKVRLDLEEIQKMEQTICEISEPNLDDFWRFASSERIVQEKQRKKVLTSKNPKQKKSLFESRKKKSLKKKKLKKINIAKIKYEAQEQIDHKIKTRSIKRKNKFFFSSKKNQMNQSVTQKNFDNKNQENEQIHANQILNFSKIVKKDLFGELDKVKSEVFDVKDKAEFKNSWSSLRNPSKFIVWIIYFYEFKFKNINLKLQTLESENGKREVNLRNSEQFDSNKKEGIGKCESDVCRPKKGI